MLLLLYKSSLVGDAVAWNIVMDKLFCRSTNDGSGRWTASREGNLNLE